jgi:hypothetical protein
MAAERLSDEELAGLIEDCRDPNFTDNRHVYTPALEELRDRRATEANGWECVRHLVKSIKAFPPELFAGRERKLRLDIAVEDAEQAARAAGIDLDDNEGKFLPGQSGAPS